MLDMLDFGPHLHQGRGRYSHLRETKSPGHRLALITGPTSYIQEMLWGGRLGFEPMDPPQSSWSVPRLHASWLLSSLVPPEAEANVLWLRMGGGPAAPHTHGSSSCDFLAPCSAHPCLLPDYVLTAMRTQGRGRSTLRGRVP